MDPAAIQLPRLSGLLMAAFLVQNAEELWQGGPTPPPFAVAARLVPEITQSTRITAIVLISLVICLPLLALLVRPDLRSIQTVATAIAAALCFNALLQCGMAVYTQSLPAGSITGTLLMLPAAIALFVGLQKPNTLGPRRAYVAGMTGILCMPPILLSTWFLAAALQ